MIISSAILCKQGRVCSMAPTECIQSRCSDFSAFVELDAQTASVPQTFSLSSYTCAPCPIAPCSLAPLRIVDILQQPHPHRDLSRNEVASVPVGLCLAPSVSRADLACCIPGKHDSPSFSSEHVCPYFPSVTVNVTYWMTEHHRCCWRQGKPMLELLIIICLERFYAICGTGRFPTAFALFR